MLVGRLVLVKFHFLVFENSKIVRVNGWNVLDQFADSISMLKLSSYHAESSAVYENIMGCLDREE